MASSGDNGRTVGRYTIVREIGRGGMATVFLARQQGLERDVALKQLAAFHAADATFSERFLRESQMAGSLSHPNIVTVFDFFEADGSPYIAMEYLERGSLRPWISSLDLAASSGAIMDVLAGLAHAEERRIVHRDLKPENLMLTNQGRIKIADFGIAKAYDEATPQVNLTQTGMTMGTPTYMAPEQALGKEVGPWTDLYSVGVIAYEMLVGKVPFHDSDTPMAILMRQVNDPIPPPRSINPDLDPDLGMWLEKMLHKDPEQRYRSATEAGDDLDEIVIDQLGPRWRRSSGITTLPIAAEAGAAAGAATVPPTAAPPVTPPATAAPADDGFVTFGAAPVIPPSADVPPAAAEPPPPPPPPPPAVDTPAEPQPEPAPVPAMATAAPVTPATQKAVPEPEGTYDWPTAAKGGGSNSKKTLLVIGAVVVLIAAVAAVYGITQSGGSSSAKPPPITTQVTSWTVANFPQSAQSEVISGIGSGPGGFAAVGYVNSAKGPRAAVWTSPTGATWKPTAPLDEGSPAGHQSLGGVVVNGPDILVSGRTPTKQSKDSAAVWMSTDGGATWKSTGPAPDAKAAAMHDVVKTPNGYVGVGESGNDAAAWTSADGTSWKPACPYGASGCVVAGRQQLRGATALGNVVVAVGEDNGKPSVWGLSPSGWSRVWLGTMPGSMADIAQLNANTLVAVGFTGTGDATSPTAWTSVDGGAHWTAGTTLAPPTASSEAWGVTAVPGGGATAVGGVTSGQSFDAAIWTTTNGKTWKQSPPSAFDAPAGSSLNAAAAGGGAVIAAGWSGVGTSQRAAAWREPIK